MASCADPVGFVHLFVNSLLRSANMSELLLSAGSIPLLRCPLFGQSVRVGRSPTNDIALPDEDVPSYLCSFEAIAAGKYRVSDRSGKGIYVNGKQVSEAVLDSNAVVSFGKLEARYVSGQVSLDTGTTTPSSPTEGPAPRTGILRSDAEGKLHRTDLNLRLPPSLGDRVLPIPARGLRIGASPDNDLVIDDGFVSSFHAEVYLRGERLFVRDLDSTNGTFIGHIRVIEAEVRPEAVLRMGQTELRVEPKESPERVAAPAGPGPWQCGDLLTRDARFAKSFQLIEKVAPHDATVLIHGETGTGKELVARALHEKSGRSRAPLVSLNCAAIPQGLIESELFGHEKGAFTGADRTHRGVFEQAEGGTLFLDEVGELPLELQAKLLRVLETRSLRRVGGRGDIAVQVRVVAATHRDLVEHVRNGKFREDLLHRLYVIALQLPALRQRSADIGFLARHFANLLSPNDVPVELSADAEKALLRHPFPGNVRELRNVIQRALILGDGHVVTEKDLEFLPLTLAEQAQSGAIYRAGMTMEEVEKEAFRQALAVFDSAAEAARSLGMPKTTFWRRATALGLLDKKLT